jgi:potassium/hydrogen antiporter
VSAREITLTVAIMLGAGLGADLVSRVLRLPSMVVLVAAGVALGPYGLEALDLELDSVGMELLFTLGISLILFHGGLGLSLRVLSRVAVALGLLAVPGVLITAAVTGTAAAVAFGIPLESGLLIGAVVAPTDPAILIPLFERATVRPKVAQTIIAESALNDPTGAVLALSIAAFVIGGGGSFDEPLLEFVKAIAISTALGLALGLVLGVAISHRWLGLWRDSPAIAVMLIVSGGYFTIDTVGGSGYLGAFIAGVIVGNLDVLGLGMHSRHEQALRSFAAILADVMVIFVFIALGVNLPLGSLGEYGLPALATLAVLLFVARPLTVLACLLPDRRGKWSREEILFLGWTRETGVVPAAITGLLVARGIPDGDQLVTTVALAIVVTLLLQSTTKAPLAHRLGLVDRPRIP